LIIRDWWKVEGDRWPSFALNLADSDGAFSFAKASENALEGSRIRMKMSFAGDGIWDMGKR